MLWLFVGSLMGAIHEPFEQYLVDPCTRHAAAARQSTEYGRVLLRAAAAFDL